MTTGERVSTLEHLEELDRLLRDVQAELMPEAGIPEPPPPPPPVPDPAPPPPVPDPAPPPPAPALDSSHQLELLAELAAGLLASTRELLAGYERVLTPRIPTPTPTAIGTPARAPATRPPRARPDPPDATISAGPFPSIEALRNFEATLERLPGVRDVAVQAYQGTDRAIIDVRLVDARRDHPST